MSCNNCRKLRKELRMLNQLVELADVASWDMASVYIRAMEGGWEPHEPYDDPDPVFAKWLAEKFKLKFEGEEPEQCPECASAVINPGKASWQDHEYTLECFNKKCCWRQTYIRLFHHYDKRKRKRE